MNEFMPDSAFKPCPFCGGKPAVQYNVPLVKCVGCGAFANMNEWNSRPIVDHLWWAPALSPIRSLVSSTAKNEKGE